VIVIKHYSKLAISIFLVISMSCTKNLEKETWIVPCNYTGTLTVYFRNISPQRDGRIYKFNSKGTYYSNFDVNQGFTPDFNKTLSLIMDCNYGKRRIPYYQDSLKAKKGETYATYFLSGEDSLACESILIAIKK
jgi:hypothetical protein